MTVDKTLDCAVTNTTTPIDIVVNQSHDSACSIATITSINTTLDVGDAVSVELGYDGSTSQVFSGYVKAKVLTTPDGLYTIVAHDIMTRAVDFFIVSTNPETGFTYSNITAHTLIQTVLEMAGLSSFDFDNTYFTFGIENDVEVNLVTSYDYSRMISDIIAWMVWADQSGTIKLKNRKPYPMDGLSGQPGDVADVSVGTYTDSDIFTMDYPSFNERDLRNKIVIYGANDLYADASQATSYDPATDTYRQILPSGYYKTSVLASPIIDSQSFAQDACDYNLARLNRLTYEVPITIEGDQSLEARTVLTLNSTKTGASGDWYIYQLEHIWNKSGYKTSMVLRK